MKRIGAVTFHAAHNYGSVLQAYALQEYVKSNFTDVEYKIINLRLPAQHKMYDFPKKNTSVKNRVLQFLNYKALKSKYYKFEYFINNVLNVTKEYSIESDIKEEFDIYISAGDQIWNPRCKDFSWMFFFDGITNGVKASYAPSMGPKPIIKEDEIKKIGDCLKSYSKIGVREEGTKREVKNITNRKEIKVLPDPVLLLSKNQWLNLLHKENIQNKKKDFIFFYTLYCSDKTYKSVKKIGSILNKEVIVTKYLKHCDYLHYYKNCFDTGPLDFLFYIMESTFVVATSFHACVFCAMFHTPFVAIDVFGDNRIQGFLTRYKLLEHNLSSDNITNHEIKVKQQLQDFDYFDEEIKQDKQIAYDWLKEIILQA